MMLVSWEPVPGAWPLFIVRSITYKNVDNTYPGSGGRAIASIPVAIVRLVVYLTYIVIFFETTGGSSGICI